MLHNLKINKEFFLPVLEQIKTFEIRKNDRDFHIGDKVVLNEWDDEKKQHTGRKVNVEITYITDYEQKDNYVVFSFKLIL
ncbi:RNA-binding protein [Bacillus pseudomycoides]|nr:RNA-binding protein [Bacillus pseudomycoides]